MWIIWGGVFQAEESPNHEKEVCVARIGWAKETVKGY